MIKRLTLELQPDQNFKLLACFLGLIKIRMSILQQTNPSSSYSRRDRNNNNNAASNAETDQRVTSPIKYLLQNNIRLNAGEGERGEEEVQVISQLLKGCTIFDKLKIDVSDKGLLKELCNGVVLIFCQNPHIMDIKDGELYIFLEGQGFEYMHNNFQGQGAKRYKIYENDQYIMVRKICTNDYFLSPQNANARYHSNSKKYQLMVDENTLLGKISDDLFHKVFVPKLLERERALVNFLKKVAIFTGLPNSFFLELAQFLEDQTTQPDQKVIVRSEKSKFVYFIKSGEVQVRSFNEGKGKINANYYITTKGYSCEKLKEGDTFGLEQLDVIDFTTDKEVVSIKDCHFYKLEKRVLAIIITSFDLEFQQKNKIWSEINLNSQIKGQNYSTPEHQLLAKNAERIRSSERKVRDLKLRFLASKRSSAFELQKAQGLSHQNSRKEVADKPDTMHSSRMYSPDQKRRMIKTTDGRFRSTNVTKFLPDYGDISKFDTFRREMEKNKRLSQVDNNVVSTFEFVPLQTENRKSSLQLRYSNAFEYMQKLGDTKMTRSISTKSKSQSSQRLIPRIPGKTNDQKKYSDRYESDLIGTFLDKKIKNEIVKKAEKVLQMNQQLKTIESKNLKRFFAGRETKTIPIISEYQKKNIAAEIVDRMSNLKDNPLLLQIENERRKQQRQLKLVDRRTKAVEDSPRKYKKEDECLLIKNNQ